MKNRRERRTHLLMHNVKRLLLSDVSPTERVGIKCGEKNVCHIVLVGGCTLLLRSDRAQLYNPATLTSSNKGWQGRWFYLCNDDKRLSEYTQRVVFAVVDYWRWGAPQEH
jgi:hypothetical protein